MNLGRVPGSAINRNGASPLRFPIPGLAVLLAVLAGCGAPPRETFDLLGASAPEPTHISLPKRKKPLRVAEPAAEQLLNSNRLAMRQAGGALAYLADAQWADRAPRLVQGRLVARLRDDGVDASFQGEAAGDLLTTDLRRFEIDAARGIAVVEIAARLSDQQSGALRGEAVFSGEAPAPHTDGPEAAHALEQAFAQVADQLARWVRGRL
jgi:cholesterol transport system auxiliary component